MNFRSFGKLTDLSIGESQFEKTWVSVAIRREDHGLSVRRERGVQEVEVMVDGGVLGKLMNDCASLVIPEALVFRWPAKSFSWHGGYSLQNDSSPRWPSTGSTAWLTSRPCWIPARASLGRNDELPEFFGRND